MGVKAFFCEPALAIINTPTDIEKIGLAAVKGTFALVGNTADGLLGTSTTITRSVGRNVAKLSMDDIFIRRREELQRQPGSALDAALRPFLDISNGLYCGVAGIVRVPATGFHRHHFSGAVTGNFIKSILVCFSSPRIDLRVYLNRIC